MIRCIAVALAASVIVSSAAAREKPECRPFEPKDLGKGYTYTKVTPGQYHFLQGVWAMSVPGEIPPGDGAGIIRKDKTPGGVIAWTKGALVCTIMSAPDRLLKLILAIKTGQLDPDGQEI
jgi:hypothetical protein